MFRQVFQEHCTIFKEGETGDCAYIIERGRIEISCLAGSTKMVLAVLNKGEIFGEMALIDDQLRSATAMALEEVELIVISRDQIIKKMEQAEPVLLLLMKTLISRFRASQKGLASGMQNGAPSILSSDKPVHFSEQNAVVEGLKQEQEIDRAIAQREFVPFFQPIVDLKTRQLVGFEALCRWQHPDRGYINPIDFIQAAESSGQICDIDLVVLGSAWTRLEESIARTDSFQSHRPLPFLDVNLSARHFEDDRIIDRLKQVLAESQVTLSRLKVEITESVLMQDPEFAQDLLKRIKDLGIQIAMDDFGTGYSSLSYLHRFPIDVLKIDRSFIRNILDSHRSLEIVRSVTNLARTMDMAVVAEGVETQEVADRLADMDCNYGQGYFYSAPLPSEELKMLLEKDYA